MKICVHGFYMPQRLFEFLAKSGYDSTVITVRYCRSMFDNCQVPCLPREDVGLEFGSYNKYLLDVWDGVSDVLFMQDDTFIDDVKVLDKIAMISWPEARLLGTERQAMNERFGSGGGKAIFCNSHLLKELRTNGGFWFDHQSVGAPKGKGVVTRHGTPGHGFWSLGPGGVNEAGRRFTQWLKHHNYKSRIMVVRGLRTGFRGKEIDRLFENSFLGSLMLMILRRIKTRIKARLVSSPPIIKGSQWFVKDPQWFIANPDSIARIQVEEKVEND